MASFFYPDGTFLLQILFTNINPFIYDVSSEEVKSSVLNFTMDNCQQPPPSVTSSAANNSVDQSTARSRLKRSAKDPSSPTEGMMEISLNLPQKQPEYVNGTTRDMYKMLYHTVNISEPVEPILVSVSPMVNESLTVYVSLGYLPSPDSYNWTLNVSGISESELDCVNCTIVISAKYMANTTATNAAVNVGIQRTSKCFCVSLETTLLPFKNQNFY